jgi:uncharacterized repeat protein (TIGR03803 family)
MKFKSYAFSTIAVLGIAITVATSYSDAQTLSVLYNFNVSINDPTGFSGPGTLSQGRDANIYTTSFSGGTAGSTGAFFNMSPSGTLTELYSFQNGAGCNPLSGVILGTDANFYGGTLGCGDFSDGEVFTVTPSGIATGLHSFTGGSDGAAPQAGPVEGRDGNYYGTTLGGASANCGTVYQITPAGSFTTLYQFDGNHGCSPIASLTLGTDGVFYGTTERGGTNQTGVVFKITTSGVYTVLYNFDGIHGKYPFASLVQGKDGNFYGTALTGGAFNAGVVFKITSAGRVTVLHSFDPADLDGANPVAGLVQGTDNNFYGVTQSGGSSGNGNGTIFRINSRGSYSVLYNFDSTTGALPDVTLLQHTNGLFYGLAGAGGTYHDGTFYSFSAGLKPFVSLVSSAGTVGATIGLLGQGFTNTKKVAFAGVPATFTVVSDTFLTATVPSAATTGFVTVRTSDDFLRSNKRFTLTQ